jgi:regulator of protease activity HflC (stomatin/prohibitin superfamily)
MKSDQAPRDGELDEGDAADWISGTKVYSVLFVALFLLLYLLPSMINLIPAGHVGVLYRPLHGGTFLEGNIPEGLAVISPINSITVYNLRLQEREEAVAVLSSNGLTIDVSVSFRFAPARDELPLLHVLIGPDYDKKVVIPTVISSVREVVGKYLPEELYTTHRNTVQEEMNRDIRERLAGKHVHFEAVLIRNIRLPQLINAAIENKLRQQQEYEEYEFRVKRESREAERKRIEAEGWRVFQEKVDKNLTDRYLRWKWIDSMLALSRSENSKVVVLGDGQPGKLPLSMPLIMDPLPVAPQPVPPSESDMKTSIGK